MPRLPAQLGSQQGYFTKPDWFLFGFKDNSTGLHWVFEAKDIITSEVEAQMNHEDIMNDFRDSAILRIQTLTTYEFRSRFGKFKIASGYSYPEAIAALFQNSEKKEKNLLVK